MNEEDIKYINKRIIVDASIRPPGDKEKIIAKDAVMNITGRDFVIICAGKEVFRHKHKKMEAYRLLSGNGMEFVFLGRGGKSKLRVHFVEDVKTVRWHNNR